MRAISTDDRLFIVNRWPECHAKRWIIASLSLSGHPESALRSYVDIDEGCTSLTVHCRSYLGLREAVATVISCGASWVRR